MAVKLARDAYGRPMRYQSYRTFLIRVLVGWLAILVIVLGVASVLVTLERDSARDRYQDWTNLMSKLESRMTDAEQTELERLLSTMQDVPNENDWGYLSSTLYTFSQVTTVGVSPVRPSTGLGRVISTLVCIVGIMVTVYGVSILGEILFVAMQHLVVSKFKYTRIRTQGTYHTVLATMMVVVVVFLGGGLLALIQSWSFAEGLYYFVNVYTMSGMVGRRITLGSAKLFICFYVFPTLGTMMYLLRAVLIRYREFQVSWHWDASEQEFSLDTENSDTGNDGSTASRSAPEANAEEVETPSRKKRSSRKRRPAHAVKHTPQADPTHVTNDEGEMLIHPEVDTAPTFFNPPKDEEMALAAGLLSESSDFNEVVEDLVGGTSVIASSYSSSAAVSAPASGSSSAASDGS